jgi:hypothetical protein
MAVATFNVVKFILKDDKDFRITSRKRVNEYFENWRLLDLGKMLDYSSKR